MYNKNKYLVNDYERNIKNIDKFLNEIYYDGFTKNCSESTEYLNRYPPAYIKKEALIGYKLFLFPQEYQILSLDELLKPLTPPDFPVPERPPKQLPEDSYWYSKYDTERLSRLVDQMDELKKRLDNKKHEYREIYLNQQIEFDAIKNQLIPSNAKCNTRLIEIALKRHPLPSFLRDKFEVAINEEKRVALVQFKFRDYTNEELVIGYTGKKDPKQKLAPEALKRKLIKQCLYSLIIRAAYLAASYRQSSIYDLVAINVEQDWFDPATGQSRNGLIASLQAPVEYLQSLNLAKLDPESCFKYLKGIITPSLQGISPIRPIFVINKDDDRIIPSRDVDAELEPESNLATLPWDDFEHLVAQLFEWEFVKNGVEVKVTRVSRDRGVDAIVYDPEPLRGGKYVLQAKRYTRTVDVSAVRDLYGTVLNEGANRGILITTSGYGPDAYEFAKDKPISLVDGQNLLLMLQKHGKKYHINLEEARTLNKESRDC